VLDESLCMRTLRYRYTAIYYYIYIYIPWTGGAWYNKVTTGDGWRSHPNRLYAYAFRRGIIPPVSTMSVKLAPPDIFFFIAPFGPRREPRNALWQTFRNICNGLAVTEPKRPAQQHSYRQPRLSTGDRCHGI